MTETTAAVRPDSDESTRDIGDAMATLSGSMDGLSGTLASLNDAVADLQDSTRRASEHQRATSASLYRAADRLAGGPTVDDRSDGPARERSPAATTSMVADD